MHTNLNAKWLMYSLIWIGALLNGANCDAQDSNTYDPRVALINNGVKDISTLDSIFDILQSSNRFDSLDLLLWKLYEASGQEKSDQNHILRSKYLSVLKAPNQQTAQRVSKAHIVNKGLLHSNHNIGTKEKGTAIISLNQIIANDLNNRGSKDSAVQLRHNMIAFIDSISSEESSWPMHDYHFKNYYSLANIFLFDNDDISTQYSDSSISHALQSQDTSNIYLAYSMKYYTRYYHNDPQELNQIADRCILFAVELDDHKKLGEAYMHKCNALAEQKKFIPARNYCDLATTEYEKVADSSFLASVLHNMGNVFTKLESSDIAITYYERALKHRASDDLEGLFNTQEAIANEYHNSEKYEESSQIYHSFVKDFYSYYQNQLKEKFTEAEEKYRSKEKEAQIAQQDIALAKEARLKNIILGVSTVSIFLMSGIFWAFYERNKRKRKETETSLLIEKQRSEDLSALSELKTSFFNNVSHELRTPLTLVIAPLEDAAKKVQNVQLKKDIDLALSNSKRLLHLTNEILDLSKLELSKLEPILSTFDVIKFLKRVFYSFDSLAKSKNIHLMDNIDGVSDTWITTDANMLEKVITNLVGNALKYSENDTTVSFIMDSEALSTDLLILQVKDQGIGISTKEQENIFQRYYQTGQSKHKGGTGIGLSLSYEIVKFLDGKISVQSQPNIGSTFTVSIPIEASVAPTADHQTTQKYERETQLAPILISGKKPSILIVEDNIEMSEYLASLLSDYNTDCVMNGKEALQQISKKHYDLISSDVMMPEMNGFELKKQLSNIDGGKNIPFILLTARVLEEDKLRGLRLGVDDYITKPFNSSEYKVRIYNLLHNKKERGKNSLIENPPDEKKNFILTAQKHVTNHLDDNSYGVASLSEDLNYSSRQLSRILQKETGLSTVSFILEIRLQAAFQLLKAQPPQSIKEVRYAVGIESSSYFSRKFKERFGVSPGDLT